MAQLGDIARELANAPVAEPKADKGKPGPKASPIPLPTPTFAMVANPKYYEDRNDKSKSNGRIAHVTLHSGPFTFEASIYLEISIEQTAAGRNERKAVRFSLPKGVKLLDSVEPDRANAWKDGIIDAFLAWRKTTGGKVVGAKTTAAGFRSIDE
jgi:hypothetical protein